MGNLAERLLLFLLAELWECQVEIEVTFGEGMHAMRE